MIVVFVRCVSRRGKGGLCGVVWWWNGKEKEKRGREGGSRRE